MNHGIQWANRTWMKRKIASQVIDRGVTTGIEDRTGRAWRTVCATSTTSRRLCKRLAISSLLNSLPPSESLCGPDRLQPYSQTGITELSRYGLGCGDMPQSHNTIAVSS